MMTASPCACIACAALLAECGREAFRHLSRKLLIRGWAGTMSPAERAYVRAHRSEAERKRAAGAAARMRNRCALAPEPQLQRAKRA
jgi:hypothetical protein